MSDAMDTDSKLKILSEEARYDLACACGTNDEERRHRGQNGMWVYPVTLPQGGKGIMLKTLMSNVCTNDCRYCPLRQNRDIPRCSLAPQEVARLFMEYTRRKKLLGLFLTSGVVGTPDHTMEQLIASARILRNQYQYRGYIHLKIIPGASDAAIMEALSLASAVSLNLEAPTQEAFRHLSGSKDYLRDIVHPIKLISQLTEKGSPLHRVKHTTQFVVGASVETDRELVDASARLYSKWKLDRIYFSAYQRGLGDPALPAEQPSAAGTKDLLTREHRLYQVDFLMRKYKWSYEDIPFDEGGRLRLDIDPKQHWANLHPECFPVSLRTACREELLRVPGLGPTYVKRILEHRRTNALRDLSDVGLKGKSLQKVSGYVTG